MKKTDDRCIIQGDYYDCFVAFKDFNDRTVIAHGKDASKVFDEAKKIAGKTPVIVWSPPKGQTQIY